MRNFFKGDFVILIWSGFIGLVLVMLALDLGVFHRTAHIVSFREAMWWSFIWITMGLGFSIFIYYGYENHWLGLGDSVDSVDGLINNGTTATIKYLTGYVVEKSLSIDNIFVIAMVFSSFAVPAIYQHRVLFWGIMGALLMRGAMIIIGARLIAEFHWVLYVFGIFLIITGLKMLLFKSENKDPNQNIMVRLARYFLPVTSRFHGQHFLVRAGSAASQESAIPGESALPDEVLLSAKKGTWLLTPLALALIVVETTDLIFAIDSIPAIFAITADPFLVFTSNVFAILGLRSLYFALAGMIDKFKYLKVALALVLIVVGFKMLIASWLKEMIGKNFNFYLLGLILIILSTSIIFSLYRKSKVQEEL